MKALKDGSIKFKATDVFHRKLIVIPEKLLDEKANAWFNTYISKLDPDTEMNTKHEEICGHLKEKFGFHTGHFAVWLMWKVSKPFGNMGNDKEHTQYTLTDQADGKKIVFDHYNGYWYTATKEGADEELIMFDYGDFYCMHEIFPLANYFVAKCEELARGQMNDK